jgi:hypothetical protein
MNMRETTRQYRLAEWAEILRKRRGSGQSLQAFCDESGITPRKYYYWQKKLREEVCRSTTDFPCEKEALPQISPKLTEKAKTISPWVSVELAAAPSRSVSLTVEVSGCKISADAETDMELLAKVCRALRTL